MAKMVEITCACGCRQKRMVREADRKRGWGKYIDKSHKARHQERRTGQYAAYLQRRANGGSIDLDDGEGQGWDAHKSY